MEWLVFLIIMIISVIINIIANYLKCKKNDIYETVTKDVTTQLSDLDTLEQYGISYKLRKAVEAICNETKNVDAQTYAKKIASVCFGCPSEKIKSNDPFGSIKDVPATPFYTYLPVPFQPISKMFLAITPSSVNTYILLVPTNTDVPYSSVGSSINELGDVVRGSVYILCFLQGTNITGVKDTDSIRYISTEIQQIWNGLIENGDIGGWVAFSNMIIENPFYLEQDALNYMFTGLGYYAYIKRALLMRQEYSQTKLFTLNNDFISNLTGWFFYEGMMMLVFNNLERSRGNEVTI